MPDHTPHREPHQLVADRARGIARILDTEWLLAITTARQAPQRPRLDTTGSDRGGVRSVGTHSDPTSAAAVGHLASTEAHPLARRSTELRQALQTLDDALVHLEHLVEHTLDFDRRTIERLDREEAQAELRAARPVHRYCWACDRPCERADGCDACRKLYERTDPAAYLVVVADQSPAAREAAFAAWTHRRIAECSLDRPGSPHVADTSRMVIYEHESDPLTGEVA